MVMDIYTHHSPFSRDTPLVLSMLLEIYHPGVNPVQYESLTADDAGRRMTVSLVVGIAWCLVA